MNRLILISIFFASIANVSFSQYKLNVEISAIRNNKGNIMLQLFDENEKVLAQKECPVKDNKCSFSFSDLKQGKYAVRYYHDENMNSSLGKNLLGKPTEGYGFSNNVTGKFGPPPFKKWLFEINGDKAIVLNPTY